MKDNLRIFVLIIILSIFLRIFLLDYESLWLDEGSSVKFAKLGIWEILKSTQTDAHPPLYYLILHFWIKIFGDSEFSLRFPSALFGIFCVIAVYKFCLDFLTEKVALVSSLITGVSTFQVFYSQEARMYSLLCLLSILSFYFFVKILHRSDLKNFSFYLLVNVLLIYTHLYSFFVLLAQFIFMLIFERKKLWGFVLSFLVLFLFYLPRLFVVLKQANEILISGEFWLPKPGLVDIVKTFAQFVGATYPMPRDETGKILPIKFAIEYASSGLLLLILLSLLIYSISAFKNFTIEKRKIYILLWFWFMMPIFVPFISSQFLTPFYFTRYAISSSIAFYIIASIGFENLNDRFKSNLLVLILLLSAINLFWYYVKTNKEEWREAVKFVENNADRSDLVIASKYVFFYYAKRSDVEKFEFPDVAESEKLKLVEKLRWSISGRKRVWLVSAHAPDIEKIVVSLLSDSLRFSFKKKFMGVDVLVFEKF